MKRLDAKVIDLGEVKGKLNKGKKIGQKCVWVIKRYIAAVTKRHILW